MSDIEKYLVSRVDKWSRVVTETKPGTLLGDLARLKCLWAETNLEEWRANQRSENAQADD